LDLGLLSSRCEKSPIKILWKDPGPFPEQGRHSSSQGREIQLVLPICENLGKKRRTNTKHRFFSQFFHFQSVQRLWVDPEAGGGNTFQFVFVNSECLFVSTLDFTVAQGCTAKQTFGLSLLSAVVLFGETRGSAGW